MKEPKWLGKKDEKRDFATKREKWLAKKLGAKLRSNSGATWSQKADIVYGDDLIEMKSTVKNQMVVKREWLDKIRQEAIKEGKNPVLVLDFGDLILIGQVVNGKDA